MGLPTFLWPWFAVAGLAAAGGAVVIHLLNRRRFRVVHWAAMDFLREAVFRSRRMLQLRDLLLLALRVLCLAAFGAALARPFLARTAALANPDQPVHAVVLVDNSLGMGYRQLDGTLLDEAKAKAREVIERLPRGSRISVVPTCGSARGVRREPYASPEDALEGLSAVQPVDRLARPDAVLDLALEACRQPGQLGLLKRIVLVTDHRASTWPAESLVEHLQQLPAPMEVIQVAPEVVENAWIADFRVRDGLADLQTPATLVAKIGYQGPAPRRDVQVTLTVDGVTAATATIDLEPGQEREVQFPPCKLDATIEPGRAAFVTAEVSIPHDRLPADDQRFLVIPVVARLPVVFVDALGSDEDPRKNRYGETFYLRRLLAPLTSRTAEEHQLVEVRHVRPEQLTQEALADARLVVVAGLANPGASVPLLREYVEQGGNLLLAAGGDFDPAAWNESAWADGLGILPAPLGPIPVGRLPDDGSGPLAPFLLDFDTLVHEYFLPEGTAADELKAMYGPPTFFFKAVAAEVGGEVHRRVAAAAAGYFDQQRRSLAEIDRKLAALGPAAARSAGPAASSPAASQDDLRAELQRQRDALAPHWLLWRRWDDEGLRPVKDLAERAKPRVLGCYANKLPFMVARQWGRGQVLFISTGLSPGWNTLPVVRQAVWLYDRVCRSMLLETFPPRNLSTEQALVLPVAAVDRLAEFALVDPEGGQQALSVDALEGNRYGIALPNWTRRGVYHVTATRPDTLSGGEAQTRLWDVPLAVNGPAEASDLGPSEGDESPKGRRSFLDVTRTGAAKVVTAEGADLWKWILAAVLVGLLAELAILARFSGGRGPAA
ncbi:MAG: VWA domain-containing protein [Thermoguttaceae bacterium]